MFVCHCVTYLPQQTRSVQVCIIGALCNYIDKLCLLSEHNLNEKDKEELSQIVEQVIKALRYSLSIAKHTKLRKEALNVVMSLGKKLKEQKYEPEFVKVTLMYEEAFVELTKDHQPEIKSRVVDISNMLKKE